VTCPGEIELARAVGGEPDVELAVHLETCAACRAAWDEARAAIELARELPVALPSRSRREEVRTALLAAAADRAQQPARRTRAVPAIAGAAAAAVVGYLALAHTAAPPLASSSLAPHSHGTVRPHAGAHYTVRSIGPDEVIELSDGEIDIEVEPLHPGERFRVVVGRSELEVRGTAFRVAASAEQLVEVAVAHGRVDLSPGIGAPATLAAGQSWRASEAAIGAPSAAADAVHQDPVGADSSADGNGSPPAVAARRDPESSARAARPEVSSVPAVRQEPPKTARRDPDSARAAHQASLAPAVSKEPPTMARRDPDSARAAHQEASLAPAVSKEPPTTARRAPESSARAARPEDAAAPAVRQEPPTTARRDPGPPAVALRSTVELPVGAAHADAEPAEPPPRARAAEEKSYDEAWVALRSGAFARAASEFSRVVLLAPDSPLVEDASFWRAVALARGKRNLEAVSAFHDFLALYARSARAGEASAMLGWLLIDAGAFDEAARRFAGAAGDPDPAVRRSARSGLDALAHRKR
jgi:TolA-binding protein